MIRFFILSVLIITLPGGDCYLVLGAAQESMLGSSAERSLAIEEAFFDGSEVAQAPQSTPIHLAESIYDHKAHGEAINRYHDVRQRQIQEDQKCRAAGKVCDFAPNPYPQGPNYIRNVPDSVAPAGEKKPGR